MWGRRSLRSCEILCEIPISHVLKRDFDPAVGQPQVRLAAAAALPLLEEAAALAEQHLPRHADLEKMPATLAECRARLKP